MSNTPEVPWWKQTTVYQIYPRSFADSNGDGIGDLGGVIGRLDYLQTLGVETLWLSPFYSSPQADFGYDISDHFDVSPEYGSLADVTRLIREVHARGMKIVFDMVLNHTSDQHPWFLASRSARTSPERSFYLWRKGRLPGGAAPPNNWRSMLGGSGWHHDAATDEWYWATFLPFQPDLDYRNPEVKKAMLDVVRHWLAAGVDGLRLDIFNAIYKDASFADNPFSFRPFPTEDNPNGFFQRHLHTIDHPDTIAPRRYGRTEAAVALARATGTKLRGFHSKRSSSTARRAAATGVAKVADMPAAAPATSSVLRSALVRWNHWATIEPNAPPVMMMGPSAPKGPPDPIEIAEERGLRSATRGSTRLPRRRMASMASGIPWPRMRSEPYRAITPMRSAPAAGISTATAPRWWLAGEAVSNESR